VCLWYTFGVMNGNGIGKIMSGIGKPMLMDKLTKERCLKKSGKLDFARVFVEVSADDELPQFLEIEYPVISDRPDRIGKLIVKYQWKPPQCLHCKTFGHSTVSCKIRPRTKEEIATKVLKEALKVNKSVGEMDGGVKAGDNDFTTVGKKNKPVVMQSNDKLNGQQNRSFNSSFQSRGFQGNFRANEGYSNGKLGNASTFSIKNLGQNVDSSPGLVLKPPLSSKYNDNVLPKVLIRGSGFSKAVDSLADNVPVSNSFQALDDHEMVDKEDNVLNSMDEEYHKVILPKLQNEVVDVMKSGVYPSMSVRSNWSLSQLDFFYNNCPKYGMKPYVDDEVESNNEGMAVEMKPVNEDEVVPDVVNGWDPNAVKIKLHSQTSQVMNVFVEAVSGNQKFFCSFVYVHYNDVGRRSLWRDLSIHIVVVKDAPWVLLCDFNVILDPSERSFGSSSVNSGMEEFRKYISRIEVNDLVMSGLQYTWNKIPKSTNSLLKKLDRVMCNMGFLDKFLNSNAVFLPFVCSDHAPSVLNIPFISGPKPKPFKFANFLATKADFLPSVKSVWDCKVPGYAMFSIVSKLKLLKKPLRKLKYSQGDLAENVKSLNEIDLLKAYTSAVKDEELFLKQRSKISWLSEDLEGNVYSGNDVGPQFVRYFEKVLGSRDVVDPIIDPALLFSNKLSLDESEFMVRPVSKDEIKIALFSMDDDKASGPDGFSSKFFKHYYKKSHRNWSK
ncbi:RNA-directed DNA polymerase, eukaryota, reverse transcriptase zinc-binding domain protein, partial [Tanacetum coccineum]